MSSQIERPQHRGGRVKGAEGYHKEDILALLKCVKRVVPTTGEEWDDVLAQYRQTHSVPNTRAHRDANSLKSKFKQLARGFATGKDPRPEVQEAGAIVALLEAKNADGSSLQRRGGRVKGAEGFSAADNQAVLRSVRQVVPVFKDNWERVAEHYTRVYAEPNGRVSRDAASLKHKFQTLLKDVATMPRAEMEEMLSVRSEIDVKIRCLGQNAASVEDRADVESGGDMDPQSDDGTEVLDGTVSGREQSAAGSEDADKALVTEPRRRGRTVGAEGYTRTDMRALVACVKEVLPVGPTSWEQALQLYRSNHTTPNNRASRNATGIKIKFKQLVNWKHDGKMVPDEVLEARAIQKEIDLSTGLGKRPRSETASSISFAHTPEASTPEACEERHFHSPHTETRNDENVERRNEGSDTVEWSASPQVHHAEPAIKRHRHSTNTSTGSDNDALRAEIANRELELLRQREEREAEQAVWEKERAVREKQRMDMEAWTFVCGRLRELYRERATEKNPEIVSEIDEEVAVLKKKKQRLGGLM